MPPHDMNLGVSFYMMQLFLLKNDLNKIYFGFPHMING